LVFRILAKRVFFRVSGFQNHFAAYDEEKEEGHPVVHRFEKPLESTREKETNKGHEELKQAKGKRAPKDMAERDPFNTHASGHTYGKGIHR